jgi:hypothetical protein
VPESAPHQARPVQAPDIIRQSEQQPLSQMT